MTEPNAAPSAALKAPQPDTEQSTEQFEQDKEAAYRRGYKHGWRQAIDSNLPHAVPPHPDSVRLAKIRAEGAQFVVTGRDIYAAVPWPDGTRVIVAPLDWIDSNAAPTTTPAGGVER